MKIDKKNADEEVKTGGGLQRVSCYSALRSANTIILCVKILSDIVITRTGRLCCIA